MHMMDALASRAKTHGPVCVGLDTQVSFLPQAIQEMDLSLGEKILLYNKKIVDATYDNAACYKVQIACYEALGLEGLDCFAKTLRYVRQKGVPVISDAKRGDISSTAAQYAKGHFTGDFETDLLTINAYMGVDVVSPFYPYLEQGKGLFALVKTSNPGSGDFQDLVLANGDTVYQRVAKTVSAWGEAFIGESGYSAIGAVVGLTYPKEFQLIKQLMPHTFFLIPGYGAQGGTGKDIAQVFADGVCGVVNSSRGLLCAHKGKSEGLDFDVYTRQATIDMRKDIEQWL